MCAVPTVTTSPLELGPGIVQQFERSAAVEWLETDGLGDFACGTVAGPNTRREHGLFTVFLPPPRLPMLLLAALDVVLEGPGGAAGLSCHQYAGARHPEGFRLCTRFRAEPMPEWRFEYPGPAGAGLTSNPSDRSDLPGTSAGALTRRVFMPRGVRCAVNCWTLDPASPSGPWRLRVRPLCAWRESGALTSANDQADFSLRPAASSPDASAGGAFSILPYPGCPEMFFRFSPAGVKPERLWYYRFLHPWDAALGLDGKEDLFCPCELVYDLAPGRPVWLVAGTERAPEAGDVLEARELERRAAQVIPGMEKDPLARRLAHAAEAFTLRDAEGRARMVAGYPEPCPPGRLRKRAQLRSTLIALPGVLLCTRRLAEARDLLDDALAALEADAALPAGAGAPGDEPLWFIRAAELYLIHSRDWAFLRDRLDAGCDALARRYSGNSSESGYRLMSDGLLFSPDRGEALTWMDATVDDRPVTPRAGKPVEVNALWHHALGLLARWTSRRNEPERAQQFLSLRELAGKSFRHRFWNESEGCLFDVVDPPASSDEGRKETCPPAVWRGGSALSADPAIRPNQIFAVSLPSDLLERRQAAGVLSVVEKRLLSAQGLRTLSLEDRAFQPRYGGGAVERAAARHQGSIFPWLLGPYVDAVFRVHGRTPRACARARACLEPLLKEHLGEACLGQVSELFHGAAPHAAQGAFAHAPAVGEVLRAYLEAAERA